jgi:hypothetical protein
MACRSLSCSLNKLPFCTTFGMKFYLFSNTIQTFFETTLFMKSDMSQTYLYFLMLHACLYTICFVFCYTSWRFYAFSETNLLMRCHSVSSLFSAVFVFQKSYTGNILRIGRNKSRTSYFSQSETKSEDETEGGQSLATP